MMLTGLASPEDSEGPLPPPMRLVVLLTAFLSVPFFAVPAAMLTWGFEGEAQRLATRERRRATRRALYVTDAGDAGDAGAGAGAGRGSPEKKKAEQFASSSSSSDSSEDADSDYEEAPPPNKAR